MSAAQLRKEIIRLDAQIVTANEAVGNFTAPNDADIATETHKHIIALEAEKKQAVQKLDAVGKENTWSIKITYASEIKPVAIKWLWPQWIALGKLTILAGAGGSGKTTMALSLAATLTNGGLWPDDTKSTLKGNVLIWSSEDDWNDTIVPRLIAAGADLNKIVPLQSVVRGKGEDKPFDPATDIDLLREVAKEIGGVSLLILDPVVNLVKGDMHKANDVRRSLQAVVDFAQEMNCAIIGISHFSKGSVGAVALDRVIGSQAFGAFARAVLVVGKQDDSENRVLARAKSNIGNDQGGCSYLIEQCTVDDGYGQLIETTRTAWGDYIEGSASEILSTIEARPESSGESDPVEALKAILQAGKMHSQEANKTMTANGYTAKQTRTAREKLKVVITRAGSGNDMKSYWELPRPSLIDSITAALSPSDKKSLAVLAGANEESAPLEDNHFDDEEVI